MKIHKLANIVAIPFALVLFYILYQTFLDDNSTYLIYGMIPAAFLILIYLFSPQINYWWLKRNPIPVDEKVISLIEKTNPFYRSLNEEDKQLFHNRIALYTEGSAFIAKGMDQDFDVPYDIKMMTAQVPVSLMWLKKDALMSSFERIVVYKHAFPSPKFKFLHTAETDIEDGVIIFSLQHTEAAYKEPHNFYNPAWHAYAEAFIKANPNLPYANYNESAWETITQASGFEKKRILDILGFESVDIIPVLITTYFLNKEGLRNTDAQIYESIDKLFKN
jgi:hypothetical protein